MTDFYAYFELIGTVTIRVGGVSARDARSRMPDEFNLLEQLVVPNSQLPVRDFEVVVGSVLPSWEAEEFAHHAFLDDETHSPPHLCERKTAPRPSGMQYMWNVDTRVFARCGFVIAAPTRALAESRTAEALCVVQEEGFVAIEHRDIRFAKVETLDVRPWTPTHLYAQPQETHR